MLLMLPTSFVQGTLMAEVLPYLRGTGVLLFYFVAPLQTSNTKDQALSGQMVFPG